VFDLLGLMKAYQQENNRAVLDLAQKRIDKR
jgi:hypothetical protein